MIEEGKKKCKRMFIVINKQFIKKPKKKFIKSTCENEWLVNVDKRLKTRKQ